MQTSTDRGLGVITALAWICGTIALVMFWLALLGIPWSLVTIGVGMGMSALMGIALWRQFSQSRPLEPRPLAAKPLILDEKIIGIVLIVLTMAILFNGAYLPFPRADALAIYLPTAVMMATTGALEPLIGADSLYRTYPILVQLNYTLAFLISGWQNEMLARTISTVLSLACLPAAYLLGRELGGRRVGLYAAFLLGCTPSFARFASSGYVDLPMAFFYTLTALYALRFWRTGQVAAAVPAGMMMGLAAFTKNAGLIGIPLLAVWFAAACWHPTLTPSARRQRLIGSGLSLVLCAAIAAPWYVRNLVGAGFIIPNTAWTDQAERSLRTLAIFITLTENFALTGWLVLGGLALALFHLVRRVAGTEMDALILWFSLPFFATWWVFVSYDPRFLLLFYPILCVGAGLLFDKIVRHWRVLATPLTIIFLLIATYCIWMAVEYKDDILQNPLMTLEQKMDILGRDFEIWVAE